MPIETEVKLRVLSDCGAIVANLTALGYFPGVEILEVDQLFDLPNAELKLSGRTLRLRQRDARWTLTYKGPVVAGPHKSREEIETDVADGGALASVFQALGYVPTFRYEKRRTTFRGGADGIVTIDVTPIGTFLELEGPGSWIDATASQLGFSAADYITDSYASLYQDYRRSNPGVPPHMTF